MSTIDFLGDRVIDDDDDRPLLAVSLAAGIPHVHTCGGHARCSTCRVMVVAGAEHLTPPTEAERVLAESRGFGADIRLACQARVRGDVRVRRLVRDEEDVEIVAAQGGGSAREVDLAILFADVRDFTPFTESHLPYDVVHILNRYFHGVGGAILDHGGQIDKYMGDGVMALFGLREESADEPCVHAVSAAQEMLVRLARVNVYLTAQFGVALRCGIGIHFGTVVAGEVGHPVHMQLTAIGDAVNVASRIESATKAAGRPILISRAVRDRLPDGAGLEKIQAELKGKRGVFELFAVAPPA